MSLYKGAQAKVSTQYGLSDEPIDLSIGVLQGDTLAPYLFIIVIDYIMRTALKDKEHLGFQLASSSSSNMLKSNPKSDHNTRNKTGSRTQSARFAEQIIPNRFLTDLEFADDITLLSTNLENIQQLLYAVEREALKVGLRINRDKTEYLVIGKLITSRKNQLLYSLNSSIPLQQVDDFKFLGSLLIDLKKEISIRIALAWKAATNLRRIWKNDLFTLKFKLNIFTAVVESALLYGAETWTLTDTLEKKLDGAYTRMLRYIKNINWQDRITNTTLYEKIPPISVKLRERRLKFVGHVYRSYQTAPQPATDLLFWKPTAKFRSGKGRKLTYRDLILKDLDIEEPEDARDIFLDRNKWKQHVARIKTHSHTQYLHNQNIQKAKCDEYKHKIKQAKTK
jgi:hypothetical protein